ncbi:MAG: DUF4214 domain-containing protein [Pseudomonadota bacterium]
MASQSYIDVVQKAYIAYYGRPGDYGGLTFWADQLEKKGGDLSAIIQQFGNSVESQALYAGTGYREQVQKIYQQLFGRDPDASGWDFYVGKLEAGEFTLQTIALNVLNGASGSDATIINNKLAVANQFTTALHENGDDYSYMGDADAKAVRDMLSKVTASTDAKTFQATINEQIASIHDDVWVKYDEILDFLAAGDDALFVGSDYYTGYRLNRSDDILVAKLNGSLGVDKAVLVGDANSQDIDSVAVTASGGVVLAGNHYQSGVYGQDSFITQLNSDLGMVGTVKIGQAGTSEEIHAVAVRPDGKIVAVGYEYAVADAKDAYIVLLNADMTVHAQRRIDNAAVQNSDEEFVSVAVLSDNSIVANAGNGTLVKFDANLNLVKAFDLDWYVDEILALPDGRLMVRDYKSFAVLDSGLNVQKAWAVNFDVDDMEVSQDGHLIISGGCCDEAVVEFDLSGAAPSALDAEYITNRNGYAVSTDDSVTFGDAVIVRNNYSGLLMMIDPSVTVDPNLASDYRVQEKDKNLYMFTDIAKTSYGYPDVVPLNWTQGDVSIVGSLNFTTLDGSGILVETQRGTLDA